MWKVDIFFKHTPALTTKKKFDQGFTYGWKNIVHKDTQSPCVKILQQGG